ncbi:MAG: NADH-quinone oxidoreductase subunit N [Ignavibacteriaceae bacterium]|nr:NADH-quinone oxidoreductase subunit N [Ignavibacteriaceae bacterium]
MTFTVHDLISLSPVLLIGVGILATLIIEMLVKESEKILGWFTFVLLLSVAYLSLILLDHTALVFEDKFLTGGRVNIFFFLFSFGAAVVSLLSMEYIKKAGIHFGEYYIMLLSSVLGMMLISGATDFIMIFIGLEQMSVCFYVLAGFNRRNERSLEAALKYFLLGSFATGFLVFGLGLIYGAVGSLSITEIVIGYETLKTSPLFLTGTLLFIIGFSFKIAAVPFHMWVPDVYQGAPTSVTALMSTTGKAAAFSALIIIFSPIIQAAYPSFFTPVISVLAVLSMLYGSIVAISQNDLKRMLAYSSIAHAGYMLIGLAAWNEKGVSGVIFYLVAYTFMNLAAFGLISLIEKRDLRGTEFSDYKGLGFKQPVLAGLMALTMFALSGIPPFAGFFGKYYVFLSAIEAGMTWLAIVGVISSVISVYFYLRLIVVMYFDNSDEIVMVTPSTSAMLGIMISVLLIIIMGVAPGSIINLINSTF